VYEQKMIFNIDLQVSTDMKGVGLPPLSSRDLWFESRRGLGCLDLVSVVFCQVEVSVGPLTFFFCFFLF
jgi:hypothetical protein